MFSQGKTVCFGRRLSVYCYSWIKATRCFVPSLMFKARNNNRRRILSYAAVRSIKHKYIVVPVPSTMLRSMKIASSHPLFGRNPH